MLLSWLWTNKKVGSSDARQEDVTDAALIQFVKYN